MNSVSLSGELAHELAIKKDIHGTSICSFKILVHHPPRSKTYSDTYSSSSLIRIICWGQLADQCAEYLSRHSLIAVEGYLSTVKVTENIVINEVVALRIEFLDKKVEELKLKAQSDNLSA